MAVLTKSVLINALSEMVWSGGCGLSMLIDDGEMTLDAPHDIQLDEVFNEWVTVFNDLNATQLKGFMRTDDNTYTIYVSEAEVDEKLELPKFGVYPYPVDYEDKVITLSDDKYKSLINSWPGLDE